MNEKLRVLDLFSGIGGFSLGLKRAGGFKTVAYCEIDPYCHQVLRARMLDGSLDTAPICTDIRLLDGASWRGYVDVLCGGFPCQDISSAGSRAGITGERSGLWKEMARLVQQIRPPIVFVENVSALLVRGLGTVLGDLATLGYDAEWEVIPAAAVGAPHLRERIWIVAYPQCWGLQGWVFGRALQGAIQPPQVRRTSLGTSVGETWEAEPEEDWLDDGLPNDLAEHTSRAFGNAVVPEIVERIGRRIVKVQS